jgi:outer membrane protein assembly factor BamB
VLLAFLRSRRGLLAAALVLVLAGGAVAYLMGRKPGDVSHPNVEFTAPKTTATVTPPKKKRVPPQRFLWPYYGYDAAHTKVLPASGGVRPPYRRGWRYSQRALLEFPPSIARGSMYLMRDDGVLVAIRLRDGHVRWQRRLGRLAAASPAVGPARVWVSLLAYRGSTRGRVACLRARDGKLLWSHTLPSRAESSPILARGRLVFGTEDGTVYAYRARSGRLDWTYKASGAVKGSPALSRGVLYFGDYGGEVHAVSLRTGNRIWSTSTSGGYFGRSGRFYATAAVAFGRVYLGNVDGRMYSFAARTGKLAWAKATGNYVYSSPAVEIVPGLGPTVFAGSYDGKLYAWDARSGDVRWTYSAGGRISGGVFIVGGLVWFSDLGHKRVVALDPRRGRKRFGWGDGAFNPVVSDRRDLFLIGYGSVYQLIPRHARGARAAPPPPDAGHHRRRSKGRGSG